MQNKILILRLKSKRKKTTTSWCFKRDMKSIKNRIKRDLKSAERPALTHLLETIFVVRHTQNRYRKNRKRLRNKLVIILLYLNPLKRH